MGKKRPSLCKNIFVLSFTMDANLISDISYLSPVSMGTWKPTGTNKDTSELAVADMILETSKMNSYI